LASFALRPIPRGEEFTFDYIDNDDDESLALPDENSEMCHCCGSEKCRGSVTIWRFG
jgi:[histone H3]-lysine9 N-trimethyltransferase SUV39H